MTSSPKVWGDALRRLQNEIPEFVFDAWIAPLTVKIAEDRLSLGSPTSFHRDRIRLHHLDAIERAWRSAWDAVAEPEAKKKKKTAPRIDLLTRAELAEAPGLTIDSTVAPQGTVGDEKRGRVAMRKVEAVAEAQAANATAGDAPRGGPIARRRDEPESSATPQVHGAEARRVAIVSPRPDTARHASSPSTLTAPLAAVTSATPIAAAGRAASGDSGPAEGGRRLNIVPMHPNQKAADPVRNDAQHAIGRGHAAARSQNGLEFELDGQAGRKLTPYGFDSFILGPCNALAREAALALARRRQHSLNQLYLAGASGMGKTHLARATVEEARLHALRSTASAPGRGHGPQYSAAPLGPSSARGPASGPGATGILYTTAEQFTSEFVSAVRNGRNEAWTRRYRGRIDLLVVEDIQHLVGRTQTQLELYRTIEHVLDSGGRILLTGDRPPRDLHSVDERMQKLVARGFVAELDRPDSLVRRHILRAKAAAGGVHLPADCLDLLVDATNGSVRDVEGVLIQVVTTASLLGRPIDLALTREAIDLKSGVSSKLGPCKLEVTEVVRVVAAFFGMRPEALASRSRRRDVLVPRQLSMYLANRYTEASLTEIGRALGRDHPSVRNAIQRVERQVLEKAPLRYQVEALCERLEAHLEDSER